MALKNVVAVAPGLGRPARLGALLMVEVISRIASGRLPEGSLLPTESELQVEFAVSRTALREGLKAVEERRMIEIRQGRGAVVQPASEWNVLDPYVLAALLKHHPTPVIYEQLNSVRMMMEPELARMAAPAMTDHDLDSMAELLERMSGELDAPEEFLENDVRFHRIIIVASGNLIAQAVMGSIELPLRSSRRLTNLLPKSLEQAQGAHERIHLALRERDADGAAAAMREHLRWSADELLRRWTSLNLPTESRSAQP